MSANLLYPFLAGAGGGFLVTAYFAGGLSKGFDFAKAANSLKDPQTQKNLIFAGVAGVFGYSVVKAVLPGNSETFYLIAGALPFPAYNFFVYYAFKEALTKGIQ